MASASAPPDGPTLDPDIQSIIVSGGTVTLEWLSELGVTYSIMQKTSMADSDWTAVKTDIAGGESNTVDSVSVSGVDQEFFIIEGN